MPAADTPSPDPAETRARKQFLERVVMGEGCWGWKGTINTYGYSIMPSSSTGKFNSAHRTAYLLLVGPIPEGLTLDHLCRNRSCVNPAHLEAVTNRENVLRGEGHTARHAKATHCPAGHPYTPENTYVNKEKRYCRECGKASVNKRREVHRAKKEALGLSWTAYAQLPEGRRYG